MIKAKAQNSVGVQKTKPIPEGVRYCDGQKGSKFTQIPLTTLQ